MKKLQEFWDWIGDTHDKQMWTAVNVNKGIANMGGDSAETHALVRAMQNTAERAASARGDCYGNGNFAGVAALVGYTLPHINAVKELSLEHCRALEKMAEAVPLRGQLKAG